MTLFSFQRLETITIISPPPPSLNQPLEESLQYEKKTFHFTLIVKPSRDLKNPNSKAINFDHADTTYLFIAM